MSNPRVILWGLCQIILVQSWEVHSLTSFEKSSPPYYEKSCERLNKTICLHGQLQSTQL